MFSLAYFFICQAQSDDGELRSHFMAIHDYKFRDFEERHSVLYRYLGLELDR